MNEMPISYRGHRFPPEIISHAVWLYYRFSLSLRDVEDLLAERGILVSYESIRQWCEKFGSLYARRVRRKEGLNDEWFMDEMQVRIRGEMHHLWRAMDQEGDTLDVLLQRKKDAKAARRFFRKVLKKQRKSPRRLISDKLGSYGVAHRELMPSVPHETRRRANNRAEVSHEAMRRRERQSSRVGKPSASLSRSASSAICFASVARR